MSEAPRSADLELGRITHHKLAETVARQLMDQIRDKQLEVWSADKPCQL